MTQFLSQSDGGPGGEGYDRPLNATQLHAPSFAQPRNTQSGCATLVVRLSK